MKDLEKEVNPLKSLTEEEFAKIEPITEGEIVEALEEGRKDAEEILKNSYIIITSNVRYRF